MISISLPLPPTGLRAPGSPASTAPPGDFALALADMLTIAGAETSPPILPAASAGRQVAAVPGKSLPVAGAADALSGAIEPADDAAPSASETALPPIPVTPIATPPATGKAPLAVVRDDAPRHDRTHSRRKEALAALPLPIPAAIAAPLAPPNEATATSEAPETVRGTAGASAPAAMPYQLPIPAIRLPAEAQATVDPAAAPPAKRRHVAASVQVDEPGNGEATIQAAPIGVSPSRAAPLRPARFLDLGADADAPKPTAADAGALVPDGSKEAAPGTTDAPSQPPAQTASVIAAPVIDAIPKRESPSLGASAPRRGASEFVIAARQDGSRRPSTQSGGTIAAQTSRIAQQQEPAAVSDSGAHRRSTADHTAADAAPAMAEYLKTASPLLARAILAARPAASAAPHAGSNPIQADGRTPAGTTAIPAADGALRRFSAAPVPGSGAQIEDATPAGVQPLPPSAGRPTGIHSSAVPIAAASPTRAPASLDVQPAPTMPVTDAPAPRAQDDARHAPVDGASAAPDRPAVPGPRPIALAPAVPPAAASIAAMFGGAQPLGARAPKPVERAEAPVAIPGTLATAHAAAPIRPVAEAQRTPLDMRRDDWTQKLIDRIETIRDAANATDTRIKLIPDALGKIDVSMRKDGDTIHVAFTADVPATRAMLADAQPRLAELAQQRGLRFGQASVDAGTSGDSQQRQAPAPSIPTRPTRAAARDEALTETGRVA